MKTVFITYGTEGSGKLFLSNYLNMDIFQYKFRITNPYHLLINEKHSQIKQLILSNTLLTICHLL